MVSSPDKKALYAIAGGFDGHFDGHSTLTYSNDIFKFHCTGDINTCRWTKSETTLRFGRMAFVAIPIPNSLAEKLCVTNQITPKPPEPTTAEPINPTATTDPAKSCEEGHVFNFYDYILPGDIFDDLIGDGICDDFTNIAECGYDGGDCCGDDVNTDHCDECICYWWL